MVELQQLAHLKDQGVIIQEAFDDWLWLGLAVVLDLASIGGAGVANRRRIPFGSPESSMTS